jgi:hypothetical protein
MAGKKPVTTIRHGNVKVAIWENESKDGRTFYNATFGRLYRDGDSWRQTSSFRSRDAFNLLLCVVDLARFRPGQEVTVS